MNKPLEVREFDTIIGNPEYAQDPTYKYLEPAKFQKLLEFIHAYSATEETADALDFMRISYKRDVGDTVTVKNYVGLIQISRSCQIQILPKISFEQSEDQNNEKTKRIFLKMLRSMKDFPSKVFTDADLKADRMNLYEIFISMYLKEVRQLVKHGIKSDYVRQEDNLKYFKGKLLTSEHLKANLTHAERFYVAYDEFHPNRAENRLVKSTLLKLQEETSSPENAKEIRQLLTAFELVDPSINYAKDFSIVVINRNTKDYEMLIPWSKVFLMNQSFSTFSGNNQAKALLFPMETVFESYVARNMKKILTPIGWDVSCQDRGYYLFSEPRRQFALRPDLVCKRNDRVVIMDTKWKSLVPNERINYGIAQGDMYQMYAYAKKYDTPEVFLLYPLNDAMRTHAEIRFRAEDGPTVRLHFVDLEHIEETLEELKQKIEEAE